MPRFKLMWSNAYYLSQELCHSEEGRSPCEEPYEIRNQHCSWRDRFAGVDLTRPIDRIASLAYGPSRRLRASVQNDIGLEI